MTTLSNSRTGSAAAGASTKENPRLPYATGLAGFAHLVRGSSRRIMIMRFRPANISLINRRHYLPRLLLILSSKRQMQKPPQRFEDVDRVTPYQGRFARQPEIVSWPLCRSRLLAGFSAHAILPPLCPAEVNVTHNLHHPHHTHARPVANAYAPRVYFVPCLYRCSCSMGLRPNRGSESI